MTAPTDRRCPNCQRPAAPRGDRSPAPFCSPRCQMVDLGRWFDQAYVISEPVAHDGPQAREAPDDADES